MIFWSIFNNLYLNYFNYFVAREKTDLTVCKQIIKIESNYQC